MVVTVRPVEPLAKDPLTPPKPSFNIFKVLLVICQSFCAAPVERRRKLHYASCAFFVVSIFVATCSQEKLLQANMSTIQKALYMSEYVANIGLVLLAITTSYAHKDSYRTFPIRIQELEIRIQPYGHHQVPRHKIEKELRLFAILGGLFYGVVYIFHYFNSKNLLLFARSSTVYALPNITIILVIGQYCVLTRLAMVRCRELNSILEALIEDERSPTVIYTLLPEVSRGRSKPRGGSTAVLHDLRSMFAKLDSLIGDVNDAFGLTLISNFLASLLALSIHIFVLYKICDQGVKAFLPLLAYTILWIISHSLKLILILRANSTLLGEKAKTVTIFNELEVEDLSSQDAINEFLMQLLARNNAQVACGMIKLDMAFIGGVLSALSLYVIFLIQVDLGEVSLMGAAPANTTKRATSFSAAPVLVMEYPKKGYNLAFKFELKLYAALRTFLIICQVFCVAPAGAHHFEPPRKRWWIKCLHCVHYSWCFVVLLGLTSSIYIEYTTFNISLPTIQKPLFFSEYLVYLVHVLFIITACYYNKPKFSGSIQTIVTVDCNLMTFGVTPHYAALAKFFTLHLLLLVVYTAATAVVDYFYCGEQIVGFLRSMTVYVVPNFIIGLSMSQYYALMYVIRLRYSSVAKGLQNFKKQYRSEEPSNDVDSWNVVKRLREIVSVLDAFTKEVNSAFGYSILMTYFGSFLIVSLNIFLIYKYVDQKTEINIPLTVYSVIWVALHLTKMFLILYYNHMIDREKDKIIVELSDIDPFNEKLKIALRRFLLQLMVDSRAHVVCGLLDLSMSFVRPVIDLKLEGTTIMDAT